MIQTWPKQHRCKRLMIRSFFHSRARIPYTEWIKKKGFACKENEANNECKKRGNMKQKRVFRILFFVIFEMCV